MGWSIVRYGELRSASAEEPGVMVRLASDSGAASLTAELTLLHWKGPNRLFEPAHDVVFAAVGNLRVRRILRLRWGAKELGQVWRGLVGRLPHSPAHRSARQVSRHMRSASLPSHRLVGAAARSWPCLFTVTNLCSRRQLAPSPPSVPSDASSRNDGRCKAPSPHAPESRAENCPHLARSAARTA
jgi:hypothetical protein